MPDILNSSPFISWNLSSRRSAGLNLKWGGKERWMLLSSFSVLVLCTWLDSTVVESWDVYPGSLLLAFNAVSLLGLLVYCRLQTFELPSSAFVSILSSPIFSHQIILWLPKIFLLPSCFKNILFQGYRNRYNLIDCGQEAAVQILGMCKNHCHWRNWLEITNIYQSTFFQWLDIVKPRVTTKFTNLLYIKSLSQIEF